MTEQFRVAKGIDTNYRRLAPTSWHGWRLDPQVLALIYDGPECPAGYQIDLDRLATPADMVFWVLHVHDKPWADTVTVGLVEAISTLLAPHQDLFRLCNGGQVQQLPGLTPESVRARVARYVETGDTDGVLA
ncbi:hypothetical protein O7626_39910 [Micromonospora sp. WMMD1102]|uniref:hypothetical protein n=1 Tax=Micromonospora sp. WMMD1102 TaxID=3016105 RepID=UPI002414FAE5|nr:hypothetical protein [Micromonospora sp. WMMD1102]MDG4791982.1 hypothetical protein [Micromonospora sp. WMMD1102]